MRDLLVAVAAILVACPSPARGQIHVENGGAECRPPHPGSLLEEPLSWPGGRGGTDRRETGAVLYVSSTGDLCRGLGAPPGPSASSQTLSQSSTRPGSAFLLSALAPGAGQRLLGQGRWTAYAAAEVWAWIQFSERRREGRALQDRYRDLAWLVARRVSSGPRRDGDWEYYEALTHFQASGAYDADPSRPGVQPEGDPETFNGSLWELAREIYLPEDPEEPVDETSSQYQNAFRYYLDRAYRPEMAWNWGNSNLHRSEYVELIEASDENLRRSTTMIGVILANHLLSAVDALVSGRLGLDAPQEPHLEVNLVPGPYLSQRVSLQARLPAF